MMTPDDDLFNPAESTAHAAQAQPSERIFRRPIKILHIAPGLGSGGVGRLLAQWYQHTNPEQFEIAIATLGPGGILDEVLRSNGCNVRYILPLRELGILSYFNQFHKIFKTGDYDIVHSHMGIASLFVFIPAILHGIRIRFLHAHTNRYNNDPGRGPRGFTMWLLRVFNSLLATDYVACSKEAAKYVFPGRLSRNCPIRIIRNGIDIPEFTFSQGVRDRIRNERGAASAFVVGHVGRLSDEKNQPFLLHIFHEILRLRADSVLWLVGEGPCRYYLETLSKQLNIAHRVLFVGPTLDVATQLAGMDVFILPSRSEGLGIAAVEAQAMGVPCFVSDRVPAELNVTGRVQFISLDREAKEWAERILRDAAPDREIGPRALLRAGYDVQSSTSSLNALYEMAAARYATRGR